MVAKRYCIQDAVIEYTIAEPAQKDLVRGDIYNTIFGDDVSLLETLCKIRDYRKIGKDASCEIDRLFYLQMVAEYMQIVKESAYCANGKSFDELYEEFKLDCIRDILTCNYGLGNLMEDLVELLGLRTPYNGISYMVINADICNPFIINGE